MSRLKKGQKCIPISGCFASSALEIPFFVKLDNLIVKDEQLIGGASILTPEDCAIIVLGKEAEAQNLITFLLKTKRHKSRIVLLLDETKENLKLLQKLVYIVTIARIYLTRNGFDSPTSVVFESNFNKNLDFAGFSKGRKIFPVEEGPLKKAMALWRGFRPLTEFRVQWKTRNYFFLKQKSFFKTMLGQQILLSF